MTCGESKLLLTMLSALLPHPQLKGVAKTFFKKISQKFSSASLHQQKMIYWSFILADYIFTCDAEENLVLNLMKVVTATNANCFMWRFFSKNSFFTHLATTTRPSLAQNGNVLKNREKRNDKLLFGSVLWRDE